MKRGLGSGIQFPKNMTDQAELVLRNLKHLPPSAPGGATPPSAEGEEPRDLKWLKDIILTGGASLEKDISKWYANSGGVAWDVSVDPETGECTFDVR